MLDHIPANIAIPLVLWLLGLAFAAGGGWLTLKESRKQVNGVGAKVNREKELNEDRFRRMSLAVMSLADTEERKQQLLEWFK